MELLLNLVWLLIAVGSFARWRRVVSIRRGSRGRIKAAIPFLALVCALAILFPAISVTDNLHPALYVAEDGSSPRRAMAAAARDCHALLHRPGHASPPALLPSTAFLLSFVLIRESLGITDFLHFPTTLAQILPSRAPPSL